jgi:hypothetical protein
MPNHYHLVLETPDGNLSKGMRQLNGVYTQASNRRHRRVGHLFQGRYKAILEDADSYLLALARYVMLNPVRAGLVEEPGQWRWSSYQATLSAQAAPAWLATEALLAHFSTPRRTAAHRFAQFVFEGIGQESIWKDLKRQIFLGNDHFVACMQGKLDGLSEDVNIPKIQQRLPAPSLSAIAKAYNSRNEAIVAAYETGEYSYQQIAAYFGLHFTTIGKIVRREMVTKKKQQG